MQQARGMSKNNKAKTLKKTREEVKIWFNKTIESEIKDQKRYITDKRGLKKINRRIYTKFLWY